MSIMNLFTICCRGLTERAVDDRLLDEITDANTQTPPGTRRNTQNPTGTRRISRQSSTEKIVCEQPDERLETYS